MTNDNLVLIAFSVVGGLLIELFFQLVKYRDVSNSQYPLPATAYGQLVDASNYMSVSQYLSNGNKKWFNYFLFRLLPPLIVLVLLESVFKKYFHETDYLIYMLIASITSLLPRDVYALIGAKYMSEKILHVACIFLVVIVAFLVNVFAQKSSIAILAPSISGLIDNLWSSLLIAILIIAYLKATNLSQRSNDSNTQDIAFSNYVLSSFELIHRKYSDIINQACNKSNCSKYLVYSVLIYENMNRPKLLRMMENSLLKIFPIELTAGLAQVKSKKPLTDDESIVLAAKILENTVSYDSFFDPEQVRETLTAYNDGDTYVQSILAIQNKLAMYASAQLLR
jgi:hypothetical protein